MRWWKTVKKFWSLLQATLTLAAMAMAALPWQVGGRRALLGLQPSKWTDEHLPTMGQQYATSLFYVDRWVASIPLSAGVSFSLLASPADTAGSRHCIECMLIMKGDCFTCILTRLAFH